MASLQPMGLDVVSPEDQRFFKALGTRIAELRKAQGFTQQQLAEQLGLSQQMIASYEVGRRRVPISMLPSPCGSKRNKRRRWPVRHSAAEWGGP